MPEWGRILPALFASASTREGDASQQGGDAALRAFRAVMDAVPLAIVALSPDGKVGLWSRGAERIFGWRRAEAEGKEPRFVGPEHAAQHASLCQRVLAGNELQNQPVDEMA